MPSRISRSLGVAGRGVRAQEIEGGQEHPRRTEAALQAVVLAERFLERMELAVAHQALDCHELGALGLDSEHDARARRLAVEQNRARAADTMLASDVRAREREIFPDEVHEELARLAPALVLDAVHLQADRHHVSHGRLRSPS